MITERVIDIEAEIVKRGCEGGVGPRGDGWEIQQNPREWRVFVEFVQQHIGHSSVRMLELGTGRTGGLARFCAEVLGWTVTSVDIKRSEPQSTFVEFVAGSTEAAHVYLRHRRFDVVFIDADHTYEAVKHDHALYGDMAPIIAFHDVAPGRVCCEGSARYWQEVKATRDTYETIADSMYAGIGWYVQDVTPSRHLNALDEFAQPIPAGRPVVSILSGTYNRLDYLRKMITSARASIPRGMTHEFVIVDGGSTDGSLEWLREQPDVVLLEHGALLGPKKAFTDGGKLTRGHYVIMANDDIEFQGDAIYRAVCYMEQHPQAGGGAFAFTDPNHPDQYVINVQGVVTDGKRGRTGYAQVGIYRRELAHAAGWWGDDDPTWKALRYGLDNYLTSRVLELGYTVDSLYECRYHDYLPQDKLREFMSIDGSAGASHPDSGMWHKRFNDGYPIFGRTPYRMMEPASHLRILYMPIYGDNSAAKKAQRIGWMTSLQKVGFVVEYDYVNMGRVYGANRVRADIEAIMTLYRPQLVLTQVHQPMYIDGHVLDAMRKISPRVLIVNWNGDDFRPYAMQNTSGSIDYMQQVDMNLITNGGLFEYITPEGVRAFYDLCAFEDVEPNPTIVGHDVVYLGNAGRPGAFDIIYGKNNYPRLDMERALRAALGQTVDLGFYGNGWDKSDGQNIHDWSHQNALYERSKLAIVDNQYADCWGYTSDRLFKAMAYSQCVLWQGMDGAEVMTGYIDGVHYVRWTDLDDLITKIRALLADDERRLRIGRNGREYTREAHHYDARTRQLFDALKYLRG